MDDRTSGTSGSHLPGGSGHTLTGALRRHAVTTPHEVFIVAETVAGKMRSVTFAELAARANRFSRVLRSLGIGHGSRFHVHLANRIEFAECLFAGAQLGAVMVPTSPDSTADDLAFVLSHSPHPRALSGWARSAGAARGPAG